MFSGLQAEDVEDWLDTFERVSRYNSWSDISKLNNVLFHLSGVAKSWFLNHEAVLARWEVFCGKFKELFGRTASRTAESLQRLFYRV